MKTVGIYEAKTHLSRLLELVSEGETIMITRHGLPIARLLPAGDREKPPALEAVARLKALRQGRRLGTSIREMIEEGRRA